jgi:hypothetical protein
MVISGNMDVIELKLVSSHLPTRVVRDKKLLKPLEMAYPSMLET